MSLKRFAAVLSLSLAACQGDRAVVGGFAGDGSLDMPDLPVAADVTDVSDATDVADASGAADASEVTDVRDVVDAGPPPCARAADCVGNPAGPACDTATGRCVGCVASDDTCPVGQYCVDGTHTCAAGCRSDTACVDTAPRDGGTSPTRRCNVATRECVDCVTDDHCAAGTLCVGGVCVMGCTAARPCPTGQSCCGGACVDPQANRAHCGGCDQACSVPNGAALCMDGVCAVGACTAPFADCDRAAANGCETDTLTSTAHCGSCGNACAPRANSAASCAAGRCAYTCDAGFADCDGDPANGCEADTRASTAHCGACGRACDLANATAACVAGACAVARCDASFGDCDGNAANGCEVDTRVSVSHCAACGAACPARPASLQGCVASRCVLACLSGYQDCDGDAANGCEVDVRTDGRNCGACGRVCRVAGGKGVCASGSCGVLRCDAGRADCDSDPANGCEVDTQTATAHCGGCGRACAPRSHAAASCAAGACAYTCDAGFADCDGEAGNGCEVDTRTSTTHCGACGRACSPANATGVCAAGACAVASCDAGFADCDGATANGCEVDTRTSTTHCGRCGNACLTAASCAAGACTAPVLASCAAIHGAAPALPSGVYSLDVDGDGGRAPFAVYCDMTTDGGGWTYGAILRTTTSSDNRTRVAGVTAFGAPVPGVLDNEYSVDLTGVRFTSVRIDNFTLGRSVQRSAPAATTWDATTYRSGGGFNAKRIGLASAYEFRVGYYLSGYCGLAQTNIPMCFASTSAPTAWVCDTDGYAVEGWADSTGGELCGQPYCRVLWRDTACTSYVSAVAVYGFAVR
jgi:hypothetical protein